MNSPYKGKAGIGRIRNAFFYSRDGLAAAFEYENAFRQEVVLSLALLAALFFMPVSGSDKGLMAAAVMLVLIVELLNSAVEALTDRVSLETHALAKRAKDLGSAAVLLSLLNVPLVWLLILYG